MSHNKNDFIALHKKWEKLEGTRIVRMILHLSNSRYIVDRNYQELSKMISVFEQNALSIMAEKNRQKFPGFMRELNRLLHNYLASIFSLITHTRHFNQELNNSKLNKAYNIELEKLQRNKCTYFMTDLRNYTQHKELLSITAHIGAHRLNTEGAFEIKQNLLLTKKNLRTWNNWKKDSKIYISQYKGDIDLKVVISEYNELIIKFYNWLYKLVLELYSKELKELAKIESEIKRLEP